LGDVPDQVSNIEGRKYVARLTWRPSRKEKFFEQSVLGCCYYNAVNLLEYSNITYLDWCKAQGLSSILKERPAFTYANIKETTMTNKYGVDPATKYVWEDSYKEYIEMYSGRMWDLVQVKRAISYRKNVSGTKRYNCDISIGAMLAWQNFQDCVSQKYKPKETAPKRKNEGMIKGLSFRRVMRGHRMAIAR
jgi:hypothetical protein